MKRKTSKSFRVHIGIFVEEMLENQVFLMQ